MIVRISGEGQFNLPETVIQDLRELDNRISQTLAVADGAKLQELLNKMHELVLSRGVPLPPDEFVESDLILPDPDLTLEEATEILGRDGLIPE